MAVRTAVFLPLFAALVLLPSGSLEFWQGWVYLAMATAGGLLPSFYFLRRDPALVERRLQNREKTSEGKLFRILWIPLWLGALALPGLDFRSGWSAVWLGGVPLWLTLLSQAILVCGYILLFLVMRFNTFASATIQVESGQRVISDGPYRFVRHPMYSALLLLILPTSLALGSYLALPVAALLVPVLVYRLVHEERLLRRDLPGYNEYCKRTRYRLVPGLY